MNLSSIRILTTDVPRLVAFYETLTGGDTRWVTPAFGAVRSGQVEIAVTSPESLTLGNTPGVAEPNANRSLYLEFEVDDVEAEFARVRDALSPEVVLEPTTMPWGNRSALLRDPDGTLINLFTRPERLTSPA